MKLSESNKKQVIVDVMTSDLELEDGIAYLHEGFKSHVSAKKQIDDDGVYNSLFTSFERTWSAKQAFEALGDPAQEIVLEMGCADMSIFKCFKMTLTFPNYIGIDIRRDYLEAATSRNRKDVVTLCADLTKTLPIKDSSISSIIISEVIEHLTYEDNMLIFKEAYRILKPGGKIFVSSPVNTRDRIFHTVEKETHLGHIFFWNAEDFEDEMKNIGFTDIDKKWGCSISSKIRIDEIKKSLPADVCKFLSDISSMYGSGVARMLALSAPDIVNGGCRFTVTK